MLIFSWICYDNKFNVLPDESDDPKSNCSCLRHIYQKASDLWAIDLMKSVVQWIRPWQFRFRSCQPESEFSPNDHRYKIGLAAKYLFSFISFGVTHTFGGKLLLIIKMINYVLKERMSREVQEKHKNGSQIWQQYLLCVIWENRSVPCFPEKCNTLTILLGWTTGPLKIQGRETGSDTLRWAKLSVGMLQSCIVKTCIISTTPKHEHNCNIQAGSL